MAKLEKILKDYEFCITEQLVEINLFLKANLSEYRYEHSLLTVKNALVLSSLNNIEIEKIPNLVMASLSHDITKEMPGSFHKQILEKYKVPGRENIPHPLYHSYSAPCFLREKFNITSEAVVHAVKYHSTGCSDMPPVSRIVFASDFLASSAPDSKMSVEKESLRDICMKKLVTTIQFLMEKKMPVQTDSINFYNTLVREFQNEKNSG